MEGYDGSVTIKTKLDKKEMLKGIEDVRKIVDDLLQRVKSIGQIASAKLVRAEDTQSIVAMNDAYKKQEDIILRLQEEIDRLSKTQTKTAEYVDLENQIAKTDKQLDSYVAKIDKMVALYGQQNVEGMRSFQSLQYDMERLQEQYDALIAKQQEMQAAGTAYSSPDITALQERLARAQEKQDNILSRMVPKYRELKSEVRQTGEEAVKAHEKAAKHTGINFNKVVKYTLGVRSLFVLYRKLRSAAAESLKEIAKGDPEFNAAMSRFMTNWNQIKADIGTMLQPIVQTVIPVLNMVLEKLHNALLKVASVIAAIAGQDYIDVATVKTVNYAGALDGVAKSANSAKKALGGYDKLNVISGGDAGGFSSMAKATQTIGENLDGIGESVNETEKKASKLGKIGKAIVGTVEEGFGVVYEYQEAFEKDGLLGIVKNFGKNLKYFFDNQEWITVEPGSIADNLIGTLKESVNVVGDYVDSFEDEGLKGVLKKFGDNFWEVIFNQEWVDAGVPEWLKSENAGKVQREFTEEDRLRKEAKEVAKTAQKAFDKAQLQIELTDYVISGRYDETKRVIKQGKDLIKGVLKNMKSEYLKNGGVDIAEDMSNSLKSGKEKVVQLGADVKNAILSVFGFNPKDEVAMASSIDKSANNVSKKVTTSPSVRGIGVKASEAVVDAWDYTDDQRNEVSERTSDLAKFSTTEKNAAQGLGMSIAQAVASSITFNSTQKEQVATSTKALLKGTDSVKTDAERVGQDIASKLTNKLRSSISFTEQDGKNAANELAKGMSSVSSEASRSGSALFNALHGVGQRISEGINKGTISVPVTFTGKTTPTGIGTQLNKINTTVTITLDGKVISQTVFDEAERVIKQNGTGARAGIHYVLGV